MSFTVHTKDTAPAESKPVLEQIEKAFGFIPNMSAVLAESPLALTAYATVTGIAEEKSKLTPEEQQVVMLTVSHQNGCDYCVAAHTKLADMKKVPAAAVHAIREGQNPSDEKLAALVRATRSIIQERGWIDADALNTFLNAGYEKAHLLDVVTIVALKTISNYTNHIAATPLDPAFA